MSAMFALDSSARACLASQPAAAPLRPLRNDLCKVAAFLSPTQPSVAVGSPGLSRLTWNNKRGSVAANGILDAYRKDKGLLERQKEAFRQSNEGSSQSAKDEDDETCPAECVREIREVEELDRELEQGGEQTLVVVDFYKTACGSCRYIQPGFVKLCQASEAGHAPVVFLKHNIFDEYEELSELSQKYKIRSCPMFIFYKGGKAVEEFATRDRVRVAKAINKHAGYEVLEPK